MPQLARSGKLCAIFTAALSPLWSAKTPEKADERFCSRKRVAVRAPAA
jgi:hypothetical protein